MNVSRFAKTGLGMACSAALLTSVCAMMASPVAYAAPSSPGTTTTGTTRGVIKRPISNTRPRALPIKYATTTLILRSSSADNFEDLGEAPTGSQFSVLGKTENGRAQVIYQGRTCWVTAKYLSDTAPGSGGNTGGGSGGGSVTVTGLAGLRPSTVNILEKSKVRWPQVTDYIGVRPDPLPDHPSGRALDIMVPNYRSNVALGDSIANWAKSNASAFNIDYIIWNQHIWSVARSGEGWRPMAGRGSDTANHKDHVHITVKG